MTVFVVFSSSGVELCDVNVGTGGNTPSRSPPRPPGGATFRSMPDLASARKRVTATQTSMISVHRISTAPGARIFGVIWLPLLSCGGDARAARRYAIAKFSRAGRSEEHTSELQSLMRISYAVFCLKKKN